MSSIFTATDAPRPLRAPRADVELWWCVLSAPPARMQKFETWLTEDERRRMLRFGTESLRARYLTGRGTLRWLLSRTLAREPGDVAIIRGARGRPQLADVADIDFNVTHTGDRAMIAIARGMRIGVDLERGDRDVNVAGIARKFMTDAERDGLGTEADAARRRLLRLWTCKEALSKATGDALSAPFAGIDIELAPAPRLAAGPDPYAPADWSLHAIAAPDDHLATLALWLRASSRA